MGFMDWLAKLGMPEEEKGKYEEAMGEEETIPSFGEPMRWELGEEVREEVELRRGKAKVEVASEEFYIDKDNFSMLEDYLKGCIQDRFVPWVFIEGDKVGVS